MPRLTSGWTERHSAVAVLLVTSSAASLAGLLDGGWIPVAVAVAVSVTALVSLALDMWGGAVVGLAAAAAVVAVRQTMGAWTAEDFPPAAVGAAALVGVGAAAGVVGRQLRASSPTTPGTRADVLWEPAYGSLGLLGRDGATMRLAEEVDRATRTHRPLSLALLDVRASPSLPSDAQEAALRATARLLESRSREHDVPFALAPGRLGVVLPDAAAHDAWDIVARVLTAVGTSTFVHGQNRVPQRLGDAVEVAAGIAQLRPRQGWEALLDEAAAAVDRAADDDSGDVALAPHLERGDR